MLIAFTWYQAARLLEVVFVDAVRRDLQIGCTELCLSPPDVFTHETGKYFIPRVFQANLEPLHIKLKVAPFESAN